MPQCTAHAFLSWATLRDCHVLGLVPANRGKQGGPKGHMSELELWEEVFSRENACWGECVCV